MSRIVIVILICHRHKPIDLFTRDNTCVQEAATNSHIDA
jgi:hypothetical protein